VKSRVEAEEAEEELKSKSEGVEITKTKYIHA
jgi:hypothetical protein